MAKYIVTNSKFTPFTFDEMLKPMAIYGQEYGRQEEALNDLAIKANIWNGLANEQTDPDTYRMYKQYANDLESQVSQLSKEGLSIGTRQRLLNLKSRYSSEIVPIETAYKRREELAAEQRKAIAANPTLRYQRYARNMSLDDFIRNPSLDYGESYSGALLAQQVQQMAANFQKVLTEKGDLRGLGLPFQYERALRHGVLPEQVMAAINRNAQEGDPETVQFLRGMVDQAMQSSGVLDWAKGTTLDEFRAYANQGLYSALGQTQINNFTDQYSMQDTLDANSVARRTPRPTGGGSDDIDMLRMMGFKTGTFYGESEISEMNKETLKELDRWRDKGYINDKGQLTNRGWNAVKSQALYDVSGSANSKSPYIRGQAYKDRDEDFYKWAVDHGIKFKMPKKIEGVAPAYGGTQYPTYSYTEPELIGYGNLTNYYNSTRQRVARGEIVTGTPNIEVFRLGVKSNEDREYIANQITHAMKSGPIYTVSGLKEDKDGNISMTKGDELSQDKFKELVKETPILYITNSPATNNQLVELTDGTVIELPAGTLSNIDYQRLNYQGDVNDPNDPMGVNQRFRYAGSVEERIALANEAAGYTGALLNSFTGTAIHPNPGSYSGN